LVGKITGAGASNKIFFVFNGNRKIVFLLAEFFVLDGKRGIAFPLAE
jgi:hypothetical protein